MWYLSAISFNAWRSKKLSHVGDSAETPSMIAFALLENRLSSSDNIQSRTETKALAWNVTSGSTVGDFPIASVTM